MEISNTNPDEPCKKTHKLYFDMCICKCVRVCVPDRSVYRVSIYSNVQSNNKINFGRRRYIIVKSDYIEQAVCVLCKHTWTRANSTNKAQKQSEKKKKGKTSCILLYYYLFLQWAKSSAYTGRLTKRQPPQTWRTSSIRFWDVMLARGGAGLWLKSHHVGKIAVSFFLLLFIYLLLFSSFVSANFRVCVNKLVFSSVHNGAIDKII